MTTATTTQRKSYRSRNSVQPENAGNIGVMHWKEDGGDHINIGVSAFTELGKGLNFGSKISFRHSIFGHFENVECFWHYLRSEDRDDRIRGLTGIALTKFMKNVNKVQHINFRAMILDAHYQRIYQNDFLYNEIIASTLTFDCYHVNEAGIRIRPSHYKWLIQGLEEIRKALKENREPDYRPFMDNVNVDIYYDVLPNYVKKR